MPTIPELEARYTAFEPAKPGDEPAALETALGVTLPDDVKEIIRFYPGGMLGGISHRDWTTGGPYNVVDATAKTRAVRGLPGTFVLLAEPAESVVVLLPGRAPAVVWSDAQDIDRVARGESPLGDATEFATYADFFEFMLDREAEERE